MEPQNDHLNAWLQLEIRRAGLAFEDGRRADTAELDAMKCGKKDGIRIKWDIRRAERTVLALCDKVQEKAVEVGASDSHRQAASEAVQAFIEGLKPKLTYAAIYASDNSPDAIRRVEDALAALSQDASTLVGPRSNGWGKHGPAFQPQSLDAVGATIEIEEAVHRLCGDGLIEDATVYLNERTGDVVIVGDRERLGRVGAASALVLKALRGAALHAYVWSSEQRQQFQVPRLYWKRVEAHAVCGSLEDVSDIAGGDQSMVGMKPVLAVREFDGWLKAAKTELEQQVAPRVSIENQSPCDRGVVTSTAGGIRDCENWLLEKFASEETRDWSRDEFRQRALAKFDQRLSSRGFKSAWKNSVRQFPERTKPGPKLTQ